PMVWGVCLRALRGHVQNAEDVFQAVFLVLARHARSLASSGSICGWLFQTATRAARRARSVNVPRLSRERPVAAVPEGVSLPPESQDWSALHQELERLPTIYRDAVVLCELEGVTRKEAARALGVCEGTLSSRLAGARRLLARRLAGRGLALPAAALG